VKSFWEFAYERQAIWHRRTVEGLAFPWTDDEILRNYHFTNVHRELDRGTIALRELIINADIAVGLKLFNVLLYRQINNEDCWRASVPLGYIHQNELGVLQARLAARLEAKQPVWTRAWTRTSLSSFPGETYLERVFHGVNQWDTDAYLNRLTLAQDFKGWWKATADLPLFGDFTAYQVALDLTYLSPRFTDDEWCKVSGGDARWEQGSAAAGLDPYQKRDAQEAELEALGLDWSLVAWDQKPRLTLADVEHTLCEYVKYLKHVNGRRPGNNHRRYRP
jgi:hypothetical protein